MHGLDDAKIGAFGLVHYVLGSPSEEQCLNTTSKDFDILVAIKIHCFNHNYERKMGHIRVVGVAPL